MKRRNIRRRKLDRNNTKVNLDSLIKKDLRKHRKQGRFGELVGKSSVTVNK